MTIAVSDGWRGAWLLRWRGISAGTCEPAAYPLPRSAPRFGNRLRLYLDPWPSGPGAWRDEHRPRRAQDLSSGLLRQATSNCAEGQARRGADTAIPSRGSLRDRSQGISLDWVFRYATPVDAIAALNRCGVFESALCFWEEATVGLTDVLPGCAPSELLSAWEYPTKKEPGGARPPGSLGGNAPNAGSGQRHGPPSTGTGEGGSCQVAEFQCYRIKPANAEALANGRTTRTANIIGRKCRLHL